MYTLIQLLPGLILVAAVAGGVQLLGLAFRNPFRPRWLNLDLVAATAAIGIAAAISLALGVGISTGLAAGLSLPAAAGLTLAVGLGAGFAIWRGFAVGERLRRADAGQSPFYPLAGTGAPRAGSPQPTGGGAGT